MKMGDIWVASLALRAEEGENEIRRIKGVASTGDAVRDGFRIEPKSMAKAVKTAAKRKLKVFWNHGWAIPIGKVESLLFDKGKLFTSALFGYGPAPVPIGPGVSATIDELWSLVKQELTTSFSIAFNADAEPGDVDEKTGLRGPGWLHMNDILELTVATIPVDPGAEFTVKRAMDDELFVASRSLVRATPQDVWGFDLDGSAAAAAVGGDLEPQIDERDPFDFFVERNDDDIDWARAWEEMKACRQSLETN